MDYFYDEAGRLVGASYDDGAAEIVYLYDSGGNVLEATVSVFVDKDENRLDDAWEELHFGTTGVDPGGDPDEDGRRNLAEFLAESDPNVADNVVLKVIGAFPGEEGEGVARIEAAGVVERRMLLEVSEDLETWIESGVIELGSPEDAPLGDEGQGRRFYRVRLAE